MSEANEIFADKSIADSQIEDVPTTELDGMQSIMWYGISTILMAFTSLLFYLIFRNSDGVVAAYYEIVLSMQIAYWPVCIGWAAIALFDGEFSRELYKGIVSISVLGPFLGNIVGFVWLFVNADAMNLWGVWYFWLIWPFFLVYDVGQMLIQFLFVPKIYDYIDSAPLATKTA